jgi:acyl-CoA synthetase (AMP-forming)/AMP-acid ligase II/thioesterase domain-containing protein
MAFHNTYQIIETHAEDLPDTIAIAVPGKQSISYGDLFQYVDQFGSVLRNLGISRDSRVAIVLPNGPEMAISLFSVSAVSTSAPLNPDYQEDEFVSYFEVLNVSLVLTLSGLDSAVFEAARSAGIPVLEISKLDDKRPGYQAILPGADNTESVQSVSHGISADDVALVLLTSGTTSTPKIVPLTHRNIGQAVKYIRDSLKLGPEDRCLNMMPQYHIGGLVDLLLAPLASGGSVIATKGFDVDLFYDCLKRYSPTWYQAVPATLLELVSVSERTRDRLTDSTLRFIRSASSPLPIQTLDRVEDFFERPVIEIYGMTEAAPIITSNPLPPGKRKKGSVGMSVGPEILILDEGGQPEANGVTGEIVIRGANVISGYENNPEVNQKAFHGGWFHTGDMGYLDDDGYLFIKGRLNEIINRGGEKVSPFEVDQVLLSHPAIEEAVTFPVPHQMLGEDVAAAVVLKDGLQEEEFELHAYTAERLADYKVPQRIYFLDEIPRGDTGKYVRKGLAEEINLDSGSSFVAPETDTEKMLAKIWSDILNIDTVGRNDNFFTLGGYSLLAMRMITEFEKKSGKSFPTDALNQSITVKSLAEAIDAVETKPAQVETILEHPSPLSINETAYKRMKSVVMGGKYRSVQPGALLTGVNTEELENHREPIFWCFNAPDREMPALAKYQGREQPIYGMFAGSRVLKDIYVVNTAIAKHYAEEISMLFPEGVFNIGGNCRGADVASQVANFLIEKGRTVNRLCLMEYFHPRLFTYPGKMLLLFGRNSHITDYKKFNWGSQGWEQQFTVTPEVEWIPGGHGEYFIEPNIRYLSERISSFVQVIDQSAK